MVKPLLDFCCYLVTKSCPAFCDPVGSQGIACKTPLSMGFSSKNTEVGCHFLLQGIFLTQGLNPACQTDSLPLSHLGSPQ